MWAVTSWVRRCRSSGAGAVAAHGVEGFASGAELPAGGVAALAQPEAAETPAGAAESLAGAAVAVREGPARHDVDQRGRGEIEPGVAAPRRSDVTESDDQGGEQSQPVERSWGSSGLPSRGGFWVRETKPSRH